MEKKLSSQAIALANHEVASKGCYRQQEQETWLIHTTAVHTAFVINVVASNRAGSFELFTMMSSFTFSSRCLQWHAVLKISPKKFFGQVDDIRKYLTQKYLRHEKFYTRKFPELQ